MKNTGSDLNQCQEEEKEIDLVAITKIFWLGRKKIIKITIIFMLLGLIIAIFSQKEYTASTTIVPQSNDNKKIGGSLGGLASIAGINLGEFGSDSGISPALYPQIINSLPFQKELLNTPLTINGVESQISYESYYKGVYRPSVLSYIKEFTIGLPSTIIKALKGEGNEAKKSLSTSDLLTVTLAEKELLMQLSDQVQVSINDEDGYITISVTFPEAIAAAELTDKVRKLLQEYIINFKIQKSTEKLNFIKERYIEKGKEFKVIQFELAKFSDQNQQINTLIAKTKLDELQAQYDLIYGVYSELAKQLVTQEIQVKEDTPVFAVLKPVSIPIKKSKPLRGMILLIWIVIGIIVGFCFVFVKDYIESIRSKLNKVGKPVS